jgi:hypothetical protein
MTVRPRVETARHAAALFSADQPIGRRRLSERAKPNEQGGDDRECVASGNPTV